MKVISVRLKRYQETKSKNQSHYLHKLMMMTMMVMMMMMMKTMMLMMVVTLMEEDPYLWVAVRHLGQSVSMPTGAPLQAPRLVGQTPHPGNDKQ